MTKVAYGVLAMLFKVAHRVSRCLTRRDAVRYLFSTTPSCFASHPFINEGEVAMPVWQRHPCRWTAMLTTAGMPSPLKAIALTGMSAAKNFPFIDEGVDAEDRRGSRKKPPCVSLKTKN